MVFNLPEETSEDLNKTLLMEIELKPSLEPSKVCKKKEKATRPVNITLSSSSTAYKNTCSSSKTTIVEEI